jgi:hypothetical protein
MISCIEVVSRISLADQFAQSGSFSTEVRPRGHPQRSPIDIFMKSVYHTEMSRFRY